MSHGPATEWEKEKSEGYKTKLGLFMFAAYTVIYFSFIFICVLNPRTMALDVGSLNVAIVYGFGLIALAIVLALVYNYLISRREKLDRGSDSKGGKK
ncbi:MAG: DUF485 domain-containing protein [Dehalococcoidales bacterium]|jgi:uncharacterized membrane protein (DUF485 family)|nr:DUF485 domain-containing protein [Dehalococcoidales bacterium]